MAGSPTRAGRLSSRCSQHPARSKGRRWWPLGGWWETKMETENEGGAEHGRSPVTRKSRSPGPPSALPGDSSCRLAGLGDWPERTGPLTLTPRKRAGESRACPPRLANEAHACAAPGARPASHPTPGPEPRPPEDAACLPARPGGRESPRSGALPLDETWPTRVAGRGTRSTCGQGI